VDTHKVFFSLSIKFDQNQSNGSRLMMTQHKPPLLFNYHKHHEAYEISVLSMKCVSFLPTTSAQNDSCYDKHLASYT
jgi:hypothetical protein